MHNNNACTLCRNETDANNRFSNFLSVRIKNMDAPVVLSDRKRTHVPPPFLAFSDSCACTFNNDRHSAWTTFVRKTQLRAQYIMTFYTRKAQRILYTYYYMLICAQSEIRSDGFCLEVLTFQKSSFFGRTHPA